MKLGLLVLILVSISVIHGYQNPSRKTWWAKRVLSDDFYTAGRLTARQIKYASEGTFMTLISLFTYTDTGIDEAGQGSYLPSTLEAQYIAAQAGIQHKTLLTNQDWKSTDVLDILVRALANATHPVLVYDDNAFASTFLLLLYFAGRQEDENHHVPKVSTEAIFQTGTDMGFDFSSVELVTIVRQTTGKQVDNPAKPQVTPKDWYTFYWAAKPVHEHWFVAGQIQRNDSKSIQDGGFKTLFNFRNDTVAAGQRSQEAVTLLNIKDNTGTYSGDGRQSESELLKNRLDPNKPNTYISSASTVNYESRNPFEFGDDIGYNAEIEMQFVRSMAMELKYIHIPIEEIGYSAVWDEYGPTLEGAAGPVIFHCRTGLRGVAMAVLTVAKINHYDSVWAVERARQIGYDISSKAPDSVKLYRRILDDSTSNYNAIMIQCVSLVLLSVLLVFIAIFVVFSKRINVVKRYGLAHQK